MALPAGARFGPYEILTPLGAGGMGEVWKAKDTRLGRTVAVKICAEEFSERFEREARAVAALNHPNICALYDVGPNYLVMELVEGPTLAERIRQGALALEDALAIARQLAEALEAAHEKGIVHRDLKPANIKITPEGSVKVLDFGLAKVDEPAAGAENQEDSPTRSMTQAGLILGTAAYMAPEQARGKTVDKRADIWAFGVVLFEMVTGQRLFRGDTLAETLAAVVGEEPDWSRVPTRVERLLRCCLEKEPKRRLRDIGDAWRLLEEPPQAEPVPSRLPWLTVAGVALIAAFAIWQWRHAERPAGMGPQPVVRLDLDLGPVLPEGTGANAVFSPDGLVLAYAAAQADGKSRLFTRRLDQSKATELAGTDGAYAPFFSPDGRWIGFFAPGKLKKIPVEGGAITELCDAPTGRGASWGPDGNIIVTPDVQSRLLRIPASGGGAPAAVTQFRSGEISHRWPQVLPGGKAVLFTCLTAANFAAFDEATIEVMSLADGKRKTLHRGGSYGRYLAGGYLLYIRNGTAFAMPFDLEHLEVRGKPAPVVEDVAYVSQGGGAQLDVSPAGMLVYQVAPAARQAIEWLDATGKMEPLLTKPASYVSLRFAPDGDRLAYRLAERSGTDLWVYDWRRGVETRLTTDNAIHNSPTWSADGRYIAYQAEGGMFYNSADGAGKPQPLIAGSNPPFPESFSPDGKWLAFSVSNPVSGDFDIWTAPVTASGTGLKAGTPQPFVQTPAQEKDAAFSPDGHWIAYMSTESGKYEVYVRAFGGAAAGPGNKMQLSSGGGLDPVWSRNGRELFYRNEENRIMVVDYRLEGDRFVAQKARVWSDKPVFAWGIMPSFDLAPDGRRFAVLQPLPRAEDRPHLTLVMNFQEEARRRIAAAGE